MSIYAVIDTNVIVSSIISTGRCSPPEKIIRFVRDQKIIPIVHESITKEYMNVLIRPKFNFSQNKIEDTFELFKNAKYFSPLVYPFPLIDEKDRIFFEVCLSAKKQFQNVYLVTGNKKHFPKEDFVVSPQEMIEIIKNR